MNRLALLVFVLLLPVAAHATDYYIDSEYTVGAQTGSQADPACSIASLWANINYLMNTANVGNQDVTVYFSSTNKTGDGNAEYSGNSGGGCIGGGSQGQIDMSQKCTSANTPTCTNHLYLNGWSKWNQAAANATPDWVTNTSNFKSHPQAIFADNPFYWKINDYSMTGFYHNTYGKSVTICGDNVTLEDGYITAPDDATPSNGPSVLIVPTSDQFHEGSSQPCPPSNNIKILRNKVVSPLSEAFYVGGGGCRHVDSNAYYNGSGAAFSVITTGDGTYTGHVTKTASGTGYVAGEILYAPYYDLGGSNSNYDLVITVSTIGGGGSISTFAVSGTASGSGSFTPSVYNNCQGFPAHSNIEIAYNEIDGGLYRNAGESDGIDIKAGMDGLRVHDNNIHDLVYFRSIVMLGTSVADTTPDNRFWNNYLHDSNNQDGAIAISNTWGTPSGIYIFNNVISNQGGGGIFEYACNTPFVIANNVIYSNLTFTTIGNPETVGYGLKLACGTPSNNALLGNTTTVYPGATGENSAFDGSYAGCTVSCVSGLTSAAFIGVSTDDFRLPTTSSVLYHAGTNLSSLSITELNSDFNSVARGSNWDIGTNQYIARPTPGNSGTITTASVTSTTLTLNWTTTGTGTDQYLVGQSLTNNVTSPLQCQSSTVIKDWTTNIGTFNVTNLTDATSYYFCVIVRTTGFANNAYTPVNVTTGSGCTPSKVVFTAQPSSVNVGVALGTVTAAIQNASSSTCTSSTATITFANTGGTCTGMTLAGTASGSATSGLFTSTNLTENAAGACTLTATSSGLTSATSNSFTISLAPTSAFGIGRAMRGPR